MKQIIKVSLILIVLFVMVQSVSAIDINDTDTVIADSIENADGDSVDMKIDDVLNSNDVEDSLKASEYHVSGDKIDDITRAMAAISPGDTIFLDGKTYTPGNQKLVWLYKNVTIVGGFSEDDGVMATLDYQNIGDRAFYCNLAKANITLKNLIIKNANFGENANNPQYGSAIHAPNLNSFRMINCIVESCPGNGYGAITVTNTAYVYFENVTMKNMNNKKSYSGLYLNGVSQAEIVKSTFDNMTCINSLGSSIAAYSTNLILRDSEIKNNRLTSNIERSHGALLVYNGNIILDNVTIKNITSKMDEEYYVYGLGAYLSTSDMCSIINCTFDGNGASGVASGVGAMIYDCKNLTIKDSIFQNNHNDAVFKYSYGTLFVSYCTFTIDNVTSKNNYARSSSKVTKYYVECYGMGIHVQGEGKIVNSKFINNTISSGVGAGARIISTNLNNPIELEYCEFRDNKILSSFDDDCDKYFLNHGGAICIFNYAKYSHINFTGNIAREGGALTIHNMSDIHNCIFINNTATHDAGGAISTGWYDSDQFQVNIVDCYFEGNHAPIGGAVQLRENNVYIIKSKFINNSAVQGGACYIEGDICHIINSEFHDNKATYDLRDIVNFNNRTFAGAVCILGSNAILNNNTFLNNSAAHSTLPDDGLGGALAIHGNNNSVLSSEFDYNVARNGSAIYNIGDDFHITNVHFKENQAWSYVIIVVPTPQVSYYLKEDVVVDVVHIGGNNIMNAIYNTGAPEQIFLNNVTYTSYRFGVRTTGENEIHPVLGAENSNEGRLAYQDEREEYQNITIVITKDNGLLGVSQNALLKEDNVVYIATKKTDIYGDAQFVIHGLKPGKYSVTASHDEDTYYKAISSSDTFLIINPAANLFISKTSDKKQYRVGEEVTYIITVENKGSDAFDVFVNETLPEGLIYISSNPSKGTYDSTTNIWDIGTIGENETVTLTLTVKTTKTGSFTNTVSVNTTETNLNNESNTSNVTIEVIDSEETEKDSISKDDVIDNTDDEESDGPITDEPQEVESQNDDSINENVIQNHSVSKATGNPLILILLALFALISTEIKRKP